VRGGLILRHRLRLLLLPLLDISAVLWTPLLAPEVHHVDQLALLQLQLGRPCPKSSPSKDGPVGDIAGGLWVWHGHVGPSRRRRRLLLLLLTTRSMVVMMMRGRGNRGRRRIVVRHIVVVVRQRRAAIFRGHGTHNSVTGASQMLPGGRRRNMMGTATADASIDPVQRVLLHRLQIRDARRDLRAHRHLLHAVVFVAGT